MRNPLRAASIHLRVGYVLLAPLLASALGLLVVWDFHRFRSEGHGTLRAARQLAYDRFDIMPGLQVFLVLTTILPIGLAVLRIVQGSWLRTPGPLGIRGRLIVISHLLISALISWAVFVGSYFPLVSGPLATSAGIEFAFANQGIPILTVAIIEPVFRWVGLIGGTVALALFQWASSDREEKGAVDRYLDRAQLADLRGDLYPVEGRHRGNFNAGAVSPAIRAIRRRATAMHRAYQQSPPGSLVAGTFLMASWSEARRRLAELVTGSAESSTSQVYLGESTTRILHACLVAAKPQSVILSPFEHPSEIALEHCIAGVSVVRPTISLLQSWLPGSIDQIVDAIIPHLVSGLNVLVFSEVCCYTGLRVPVEEVVKKVRERAPSVSELAIVVDGAHAVGHVELNLVDIAAVYVFSGQKWMFAEYPAGIALVVNDRFNPSLAYDVWGDKLPTATADQATVIDLFAALDWRASGEGWSDLKARTNLLVEYFEARLPSTLEIVGPGRHPKGSQLRTIKSASGSWKTDNPKLALSRSGFSVETFTFPTGVDGKETWIRLSFPFFLDTSSIDNLVQALTNLVRD